ncbi:hypothetical protein HYALB_00003137 [Hymenoscyphus albidus]|uniref:Uncharacterized protein n=1 Tax=Hymenoscyphus albidus TaxID=595503 RepID=A0A9N9Q1G7_9HELO|nr:hypothetical protein HYALB_00003137 [Hymenoscyphus albidus]
MLSLATQRAPRLCIADHALSTTLPEAFPHVLVALSVNALESMRSDASKRNIRTAVSPAQIKRMVVDARWNLVDEEIVQPGPGQRDGEREVWMGLHPVFDSHVELLDVEDRVKSMLLGMKDAVASSVEKLEGGLAGVRNMDVWAARFERGNASELAS